MTDRGRIVVIGLGNPLMGDDGVGLAALGHLREVPGLAQRVDLVDGGTWGMNLLPLVESTDCLILLDAVRAGAQPGDVVQLERDDVPARFGLKLSPHQIDLGEVLALARFRGTLPRELAAFGVEPESVEMRAGLSPAVAAAVPALVARALGRIAALESARARETTCTS